jgi:hypothetical protein
MQKLPTVGTTQRCSILRIGGNNVKEEVVVAASYLNKISGLYSQRFQRKGKKSLYKRK